MSYDGMTVGVYREEDDLQHQAVVVQGEKDIAWDHVHYKLKRALIFRLFGITNL